MKNIPLSGFAASPISACAAFCAAAVSLALTGCAAGPDYAAPATPLPAALTRDALQLPGQQTAPVSSRWWKAFGSPQLDLFFGHAGRHQGVAHGQGTLLGQLFVGGGIAGRVMETGHYDRAAALDGAGDVGQSRLRIGRDRGAAGGEVEAHHGAIDHHAGDFVVDGHHRGAGGIDHHRRGLGLGTHMDALLVDHGAHHRRHHQGDQREHEPEGETLLAVVVGTAEGHGEELRK